MMKINVARMAALVCAFLLATGCGAGGGFKGLLPESSTTPIVLSDYLYSTVGSCEDGSLLFKVLQTTGIRLWTDPQQPIVVGTLQVYLFNTGKYVVRYWEYANDTRSDIQVLEGTYVLSSDSRQLVLDGFGSAVFFELGNKFGLTLTPTRDVLTAGLANKQYLTRSVLIESGLEDPSDVCPQ